MAAMLLEICVGDEKYLKELLPIVLACAMWGPLWAHKQVQVLCDNLAVVEILKSKSSKSAKIMHALTHIFVFFPGIP